MGRSPRICWSNMQIWKAIIDTERSGTCLSNKNKKLPSPRSFFVSLYTKAKIYISTPFINSSCQPFLFFFPCSPQCKDNQENCCYYDKDCCTHNAFIFMDKGKHLFPNGQILMDKVFILTYNSWTRMNKKQGTSVR